ncbi:regulator of microtubule dynamics protein 1 [Ditylenchus destructor]|uniref:Regulator of microtubule dynamics protein 1 n=1 Tax=Ditylenchus destructor TaxID=166010 RepID=A0AAD4ND14_9BILA|nr:regulator of microtubule dynamics protein 1 [Ditylenchus destructor]
MFRRAFSSAFKFSSGIRGVQVGAAAAVVALSDKEFDKKPSWFKEQVDVLSTHLKATSKYLMIENANVLDAAYDALRRVDDCNNPEVAWRLGRVLVEKANLAMEYFHKALANEPASGFAGAHKWYAICLHKLKPIDKKNKALANADAEITHHFKRAVEIDPNDCTTWHFLGVHHYESKNYKEAIQCLKKCEELKPLFFPTNAFYLGESERLLGHKDEAIKWHKTCITLKNRHEADAKSKAVSKEILVKHLKLTPQEIDTGEDF